jgi:hypothetical protein
MKSGKYHITVRGGFTVLADSESEALDVVLHALAGVGMDLDPDGVEVYDSEPNRPGNNGSWHGEQ